MGKPAATDRPYLPSLSHSFTLDVIIRSPISNQESFPMANIEVSIKIDIKPTDAERSPDKTAEQTDRGYFRVFGNYRGTPQHLVFSLMCEGFITFQV